MQKITKTFEVYEYSELSPEAFKKAHSAWNEHNDLFWLGSMLNDECNQLIKEHGIVCTSNHPVVNYSLSYSQGDGAMFEGNFTWKNHAIRIKQIGLYSHSNSAEIEMWEINEELGEVPANNSAENEFRPIYQSICKKLEKYGYDWIEDEQSEAHFIDECNANEWLFTEDGIIFNK